MNQELSNPYQISEIQWQRSSAETVPTDERFSDQDKEQWSKGTESYKQYARKTLALERYPKHDLGALQAMFLGEKAATFRNSLARDTKRQLESLGFYFKGDYAYQPEIVQKVIDENKYLFEQQNLTTVEEVMASLANADDQALDVIRGLVLGFPLRSILDFEKFSKSGIHKALRKLYEVLADKSEEQDYLERTYFTQGINNDDRVLQFLKSKLHERQSQLDLTDEAVTNLVQILEWSKGAKTINIQGVAWTDYTDSPESHLKQTRLKAAFEHFDSQLHS